MCDIIYKRKKETFYWGANASGDVGGWGWMLMIGNVNSAPLWKPTCNSSPWWLSREFEKERKKKKMIVELYKAHWTCSHCQNAACGQVERERAKQMGVTWRESEVISCSSSWACSGKEWTKWGGGIAAWLNRNQKPVLDFFFFLSKVH